mgnify:CR=1 FL=1|tara:strand:- start:1242 stop:1793 length:552 start_codon:yes stop_codon:yes gene_type:complete
MADKARGAVSMTPIITIAADEDADAVDAIHHDFKSSLGGKLEVDTSSGFTAVKWWGGEFLVSTTSRDLVTGHTTGTFYGSDAVVGDFTEGTAVVTTDQVKMICVENLGYSDVTKATVSTANIYIHISGGNAASDADVLCVGANEAIVLKFKPGDAGIDIANLHAASSSGNILVKVCALVDDGV